MHLGLLGEFQNRKLLSRNDLAKLLSYIHLHKSLCGNELANLLWHMHLGHMYGILDDMDCGKSNNTIDLRRFIPYMFIVNNSKLMPCNELNIWYKLLCHMDLQAYRPVFVTEL